MKEVEVDVNKNDYAIFIVVLICVVAFISVANACEIKRVFLPDGSMQVCQICETVVICY